MSSNWRKLQEVLNKESGNKGARLCVEGGGAGVGTGAQVKREREEEEPEDEEEERRGITEREIGGLGR